MKKSIQELIDNITHKRVNKFGEGGESYLYEIIGTNLLLRVPKTYMLTDEALSQVKDGNDIYELLFKLQLPCIPKIIAFAGAFKIGLCSQYQSMQKMDAQLAVQFDDQPDQYRNARVTVYDSIQVLEKIDGITLADYFEQQVRGGNRFTWDDLCCWFEKIVDAVLYLHQYGLIHGDLNPTNIILSGDDVYLIDFGRSAKVDCVGNVYSQFSSIVYSPPECYSNAQVVNGAAIDYWGLGVILYWLITGTENVFNIEKHLLRVTAHVEKAKDAVLSSSTAYFQYKPFAQIRGQEAEQLCRQLLSFDPNVRIKRPILSHTWFTPGKRVPVVRQRNYKIDVCLIIFGVAAVILGLVSYFVAIPIALSVTAIGIGGAALSIVSLRSGLFSYRRHHQAPGGLASVKADTFISVA